MARYNSLRTASLVGVLLLGSCGVCVAPHLDRNSYNVKITGTERVLEGGKSVIDKYLLFTEIEGTNQERVFENADSLLEWKFDSSDLQARATGAQRNNRMCRVDTYGWRIPIISAYENVVDIECGRQ